MPSSQQIQSQSYTKIVQIVDPLQTTNATPLVAWSIAMPANKAALIKVDFVANNNTYANVVGGNIIGVFRRLSGGNVTRSNSADTLGLLSNLLTDFLITQPKVTIVANTTNQTIDITVTGLAATTINWHLDITSYMSND